MANRLLHISPNCFPPVHEDHHTKRIWQELAKGSDEYHVLARSRDNRYRHSREGNMHLHLLPKVMERSRIFFFTSLWMLYLIKRHGITHILVQCPVLGGPIAAFASGLFKIPLMVEIHGDAYFKYMEEDGFLNKALSMITRYSFRHADKVRALSTSMVRKLERFGITDNVVIIPNRVDLSLFNRQKSLFSTKGKIKLVSVGTFVPRKGYFNLIKFLHGSDIDYHLTLIGGGALRKEYEEYIQENNLWERVTLINRMEQRKLMDLIVENDIYIQCSVGEGMSEGMPRTVVEAMAMRMPIISTNVGSIEGVLEDGKNSLLIPPDDRGELLAALKSLIGSEGLRERLAGQAYQDAIEKYEWNKVFDMYRQEIMGMRRPG